MNEQKIHVRKIFTPNDTPTITYVGREDLELEKKLKAHCDLPKMIVSVSGPSKSGKTVLIKKVLDEELIIPVIGSGINGPDELWARALQWMGTPTKITKTISSGATISGGAKGGGVYKYGNRLTVPSLGKGYAAALVCGFGFVCWVLVFSFSFGFGMPSLNARSGVRPFIPRPWCGRLVL